MRNRWVVAIVSTLLFVACTAKPPPPVRATALYLAEEDSGDPAVPIRMLVTPKFLRIDDGIDDKDFTLYDRAARMIYNVSTADRLILVIPPVSPSGKPQKLFDRTKRDTAAFPPIGGKSVVHYRLLTNGRLCYDLYAADDLLPEAVIALREYREALSGEQRAAIGQMPSELKAPCDLANHVYSPTRHLAHGFPVRLVEFDTRDPKRRRVTELKDFRTDLEVPPDSFTLPEGFRRMNIRELQKR